ncbi:MAG: APC family permease [Planctomycetota bacterium]
MSTPSASALVAASMIGAGVYTTSGFSLADLGSPWWVLLAWLIGGVIAICGAICYGALAERFTESGGEYLFLARGVHPAAGITAGCVSLLAGFTGAIAFAATTFETYLRDATTIVNQEVSQGLSGLPEGFWAVAMVLVASCVHSIGLKSGTVVQNLVVFAKFGLISLFLLLAFSTVSSWQGFEIAEAEQGSSQRSGWAFALAFANALTWISLSYSGFNAAVYLASEVREPKRTVPRAMVSATVGVTVLYLLLNAVFVLAPPADAVSGQPNVATVAARSIGGYFEFSGGDRAVGLVIQVAILCGLMTSISALVQTGPRVFFKMARDGVLPRWVVGSEDGSGEDSPHCPRRAIWIQAFMAIIVILISRLREQLDVLGLTLSVCAAFCGSLVFFLRHGDPPIRVRWYPIVPLIYVGGTMVIAVLTAIRAPVQAGVAAGTLLIGVVVYGVGAVMKRAGR